MSYYVYIIIILNIIILYKRTINSKQISIQPIFVFKLIIHVVNMVVMKKEILGC